MAELTLTVIISAMFFWGAILCITKFLSETTTKVRKLPFCKGIVSIDDSLKKTKVPYKDIILYGIGIRILIFLAGILIIAIFQSEDAFSFKDFLGMWHKWDSTGYTNIAKEGYAFKENGKHILLVFFPLYSLCMKFVRHFVRDYYVSGLIVSYAFYLGSLIYIYRLAVLDFSESVAKKSIVLISIFPFSFFFGSIHTESITLFMMTATLYYIRIHSWSTVMVFGALSGLCRMVGSLVAVPALIEYVRYERPFFHLQKKNYKKFWKDIFTKFIYIPLIGIGGLIYLYINYSVDGSPTAFLVHQKEHWYNTPQFITKTIFDLFHRIFDNFNSLTGCIWLPELLIFVIAIILLMLTWRKIPSMYSIFLLCYIVISYSASWLLSGSRYMSIALPMFYMLAVWTDEKESRYQWTVLISVLFLAIYLTAFLTNKQVM